MDPLADWENFYVIVGSSAGALIGLQFVVTLVADTPVARRDAQAGNAFALPRVVHFGIVLFLSAIVSASWNGTTAVSAIWGLIGLGGLAYSLIVTRRMIRQESYEPVIEDWLFHFILLIAAYITLAVSACVADSHTRPALFLVGASTLQLLFIGIHNAWDTVMYHVFVRKREEDEKQSQAEKEDPE